MLGSIDAYVVRSTLLSFLIVLISLTGVIWVTQALRGIDLMTAQGQTVLVFLGITGLAIPVLALIIAPLAILLAVTHTLNRLATDSEIIVMNAAGLSPWRFLRPFMYSTVIVACLISFLAVFLAPECLRALRRWHTEIGADVLANVLQPGQFIRLDKLVLRVQERRPGGVLVGVFIDDQRNPAERINITAQNGVVQKTDKGSFLVLSDGNLQRFQADKKDPLIVAFKSYAFDMSQFSQAPQTYNYNARERFISELISPPKDDQVAQRSLGQFRAELHDRLLAGLYPFVFVILAFAFLGPPRTTRQGRNFAISMLILVVLVVRIGGYACSTIGVSQPAAIAVQYAMLLAVAALSGWMIVKGVIVDPPANIVGQITRLWARLPRFGRR
ncbi:LPS export ABC transporter permease LptF [Afipia carboxidovorans]|uniref:LPS export ABC transporter permease LptF n=1 Tax=Afipia carboxidovorans TaxID=40137 RepID=UPI0030925577|nr:LPS export ABC transporter permease LptF [Afipia carboxidovorans]